MYDDKNTLERLAANKTSVGLGILYFIISGLTSFMFFHENLPTLVSLDMLGSSAAIVEPIISGLVGVALFDGAAVGWLTLYLRGCDNNEQRSIARLAFWAAIGGSSISSFAHLFLTGNSLLQLPADFEFGISVFSVFIIALAVVLNFVAKLQFDANSNDSKEATRESTRRGRIQAAEDRQADQLDKLIVEKTESKLEAKADNIAEKRSDRIAQMRERLEMGDDYKGQPRRQPAAGMAVNGHPAPGIHNRVDAAPSPTAKKYYQVWAKQVMGGWTKTDGSKPFDEAIKTAVTFHAFPEKYTGTILIDDETGEPHPKFSDLAHRLGYKNKQHMINGSENFPQA